MINLKQSVGELSTGTGKGKLPRKDSEMDGPSSTETHKRSRRGALPLGAKTSGAVVARVFSRADVKPFDELEWEQRTAEITDDTGRVIFKQENVEVPKSWSILATKVVVSKYFYGENGTTNREHSGRQLIHRVTRTIADWGKRDGYFASDKDAEIFYDELTWLCVNQYGSFNSPVWFN